jgi:hypothetical protein
VLRPGQEAVEVREVALNPSTCQARVERGVPTGNAAASQPPASDWTSRSGGQKSTFKGEQSAKGSEDVVSAAARRPVTRSKGFHRSFWKDPVNIVVNRVGNTTRWRWNRIRVVGPVYGYYNYGWFAASGWRKKSSDFNNYYTSYQTTASSRVHYRNGIFCEVITGTFGSPTHAYYNRNKVHGRFNGNLVGEWNSYLRGGCRGLLRFDHVLKRTRN